MCRNHRLNLAIIGLPALGFALLLGAWAAPARALGPLDAYLRASEQRAFGVREAAAVHARREAELEQARRALLPSITGTARYLLNQYEAIARAPGGPGGTTREAVITPTHQRDFTVTGSVPLVDIAKWRQIAATKRSLHAAHAARDSAELEAKLDTVRQYYRVVAAEALHQSAQKALAAAEKSRDWMTARLNAGLATELDAQRARAEVEHNHQLVADAAYQLAVSHRALETVSGVAPSQGAPGLEAELTPEPPLERWLGEYLDENVASVRVRKSEARAQEARTGAARALLYPTVEASGSERFTNAPGFGKQPYYQIGVSATVKLDVSAVSAFRAEQQNGQLAQVREASARRDALDRIHNAWFDVARQIEKSRSSRAQLESAELAARIARERYAAGAATFLDVALAERDSVGAHASRILSAADLCTARAELRLVSGSPLELDLCKEVPQ